MRIFITRILGRYAPVILAPAESYSLEPCTAFYGRINRSSTEGLTDSTEGLTDSTEGITEVLRKD